MVYPQAIRYLESFVNYELIPAYPYKDSLKLERIKQFLDRIGRPQEKLNCFHVAGTKGKGSTCAFLAYILRAAGYKTGLYTSPHLSDFRERIRILSPRPAPRAPRPAQDYEGMVTRAELAALVQGLRPEIEKYNQESAFGPLTFFEVYTALALAYFKEKKVDFTVLETGLGGRMDATNVVEPLVCAITPISYEHTQKLGNTLAEIAAEKAGIIKRRVPVVISAPQEKEAMAVIKNKCLQTGAKLYIVGRDIKCRENKTGFKINSPFGIYKELKIKLQGRHQLINAATAVGMLTAFEKHNTSISAEAIKKGLYHTVWPGRCEVISRCPAIVLDGAQNSASAAAIAKTIKEDFSYRNLVLVFGISMDKDIKGVCGELEGLADKIILTKSQSPRAARPEDLTRYFKGRDMCLTQNIAQARSSALSIAKKSDLILVTGSLFVVGEFRDARG